MSADGRTSPAGREEAQEIAACLRSLANFYSDGIPVPTADALSSLGAWIGQIDQVLQDMLRHLLKQPKFRRLEASYRNLWFLLQHAEAQGDFPERKHVKVFFLDVNSEELQEDLDQPDALSHLNRLLYHRRFDMLIGREGGEIPREAEVYPLALLVLDFELVVARPRAGQINLHSLISLSKVGTRVFCPLIVSASPRLFNQSSFRQLSDVERLSPVFDGPEFIAWQAFRESDYARMVAVALPRVLLREPYRQRFLPSLGCYFDERHPEWSHEDLLWGNASYSLSTVFVRSFKNTGWFVDVAGVNRDLETVPPGEFAWPPEPLHGVVTGLPSPCFPTERPSWNRYPPVETLISEQREAELSALGFVGLYAGRLSGLTAVLSCPSLQQTEHGRGAMAASLRLSAIFPYMVVVSRMAHLLRSECIAKIGGLAKSENEIQMELHRWLYKFTGSGENLKERLRRPFNVSGTTVEVVEDMTNPGVFGCRVRLCPHHKYSFSQLRLELEPVELAMGIRSTEGKAS